MLSNTRGILCSLLINERLISLSLSDHLTKSIDQSITTIEQTSSILSRITSMDFFYIKNMIELSIANSHLREKQLENVIGKKKRLILNIELFDFFV
jgi:hypothetical protein